MLFYSIKTFFLVYTLTRIYSNYCYLEQRIEADEGDRVMAITPGDCTATIACYRNEVHGTTPLVAVSFQTQTPQGGDNFSLAQRIEFSQPWCRMMFNVLCKDFCIAQGCIGCLYCINSPPERKLAGPKGNVQRAPRK